jgi:flagellar FliL protein
MTAVESAASAAAESKAPGFSLMRTLMELAIVTAMAIGAGALLATLLAPPPVKADATTQKEGASSKGAAANKECARPGMALVDLPPIVTNIGSPTDIWARVEAAIVIDGKNVEHPEILAGEIASDELAYLRTLNIAQIEGPIGLENVRQDLADRAYVRSNGKVSEFILKTLVLQ